MRLFFGIALSEPVRERIVSACDIFKQHAPAWRGEKWVTPQNLHLTLAFLGDIDPVLLGSLGSAARSACEDAAWFTMTVGRIVATPRPASAGMLWATLESGEREAAALSTVLYEAAAPFGVSAPRRSFAAHLTLVRTRRPRLAPADALAAANEELFSSPLSERTVSVTDVILYSSTLTSRGPAYEPLATLPLGGD